MPVDHYENFPVASWLLPARVRPPIEAIYAFARSADDLADEGDLPDAQRLAALDRYLRALDEIERGATPAEAPFTRIAWAIRECALPVDLLRDLIDAFKQDVVKKRYADFAELMDYSRRSANPVGRLVLHVFQATANDRQVAERIGTPTSLSLSDLICSGLQFINFWQDVAVDWRKGRVYIPREDLERFGVGERHMAEQRADDRWRELMAFECARARRMLLDGAPLGALLPGRLGIEIRATIRGGAAIADKIDAVSGDVFRKRPVLGIRDWIKILAKAMK